MGRCRSTELSAQCLHKDFRLWGNWDSVMLSGLTNITQLVNSEARSRVQVSLKSSYLLQNLPDVLRGRSIARLLYLCLFSCLIQAWETSGWKTTGWWLCCQPTRILTRHESRTWVKMEKYWLQRVELPGSHRTQWYCVKQPHSASVVQSVSMWSLQGSACVSGAEVVRKANSCADFWDPENTATIGGRVSIDAVLGVDPRLLPQIS